MAVRIPKGMRASRRNPPIGTMMEGFSDLLKTKEDRDPPRLFIEDGKVRIDLTYGKRDYEGDLELDIIRMKIGRSFVAAAAGELGSRVFAEHNTFTAPKHRGKGYMHLLYTMLLKNGIGIVSDKWNHSLPMRKVWMRLARDGWPVYVFSDEGEDVGGCTMTRVPSDVVQDNPLLDEVLVVAPNKEAFGGMFDEYGLDEGVTEYLRGGADSVYEGDESDEAEEDDRENPAVRIPKGMRPLIEKYAPQIGKLARETIAKVTGEPEVEQWQISTKPLGAGSWGVVYPTTDPRFIVKVTADPTEGPIIATIMSEPALHNHMGIIHYFALRQLPEKTAGSMVYGRRGKSYPVYVIVAERLTDVGKLTQSGYISPYATGTKNQDQILSSDLVRVKQAATPLVKEKRRKRPRPWMVEKLDYYYMSLVYQISDNVLCDFFIRFRDLTGDGVLADVHLNNVGRRAVNWDEVTNGEVPLSGTSGHWVISDPGHSSVETHPTIEELRNNPRRRNPSADEAIRRLADKYGVKVGEPRRWTSRGGKSDYYTLSKEGGWINIRASDHPVGMNRAFTDEIHIYVDLEITPEQEENLEDLVKQLAQTPPRAPFLRDEDLSLEDLQQRLESLKDQSGKKVRDERNKLKKLLEQRLQRRAP